MKRWALMVIVAVVAVLPALPAAQKMTVEQLLKLHADAIGANAAAAAEPSRDLRGTVKLTTPAKAAGQLAGPFRLVSSPRGAKWTVQFQSDLYEGESFSVEGEQVDIGFAQPRTNSRSAMGVFMVSHRVIVGEGLYGGVLNGRWPLRNVAARSPRLNYDGLKKLGGRELHRVRYRAKENQGELEIHLYFEPETYHHVATTYSSTRTQQLGATPETSSQQADQHFRLEERFSDFRKVGSATLPALWNVRYERTGNSSNEWKYDMVVETVDERPLASRSVLP